MRQLLVTFLVVAAYGAAAEGIVIVQCVDLGGGIGEITYDAFSEEPNRVKAFSLDISVSSGATIEEVFEYKIGWSTAEDPGYGIFPGSIVIVDGNVVDWGTPVADPLDHPDTLPGLGTYGITIEMGSWYVGDSNAPLFADSLLKFSIDWHGASQVNVSIGLNIARGGIVMEDATTPAVDLIGCVLIPEPATFFLLGLGAAFLPRERRR